MGAVLKEIVEILVAGVSDLAAGIGEGLNSAVTSLFITTGENGVQTLSTFGGVVAIFGGERLAAHYWEIV